MILFGMNLGMFSVWLEQADTPNNWVNQADVSTTWTVV